MSTSFPQIYNFPPLYTRQPNSLIRAQQLDTWVEIILGYCKEHKVWLICQDGSPLDPKRNESIFINDELHRQVQALFVDEIWSHAVSKGAVQRQAGDTYMVFWKSLDTWGSLMLQWFETCAKLNQVVTIYELVSGDESKEWEFHGMNEDMCIMALGALVDRGRATLIKDSDKVVAVKIV